MTVDPAAFTSDQFDYIWILFLRHNTGARAESFRDLDIAELDRTPQNKFFAHSAQMHHNEGGRGSEFNYKISVAHCINTITAHLRKVEQFRGNIAVNGNGSPSKGTTAKGTDVNPLQASSQPLSIASQHFIVGHKMVGK